MALTAKNALLMALGSDVDARWCSAMRAQVLSPEAMW